MATMLDAKKLTPKIVEYHVGSSDMIQSNAANVSERASTMVSTGARRAVSAVSFTSFDLSCIVERRSSHVPSAAQIRTNKTARAMKKLRVSHQVFWDMMFS